MQPEDIYESWRRRRAQVDVPADFADRVMAALPEGKAAAQGLRLSGWIGNWFSSPLAKAGICALGCLVFLLRIGSVIAVFLELAGKVEGAS